MLQPFCVGVFLSTGSASPNRRGPPIPSVCHARLFTSQTRTLAGFGVSPIPHFFIWLLEALIGLSNSMGRWRKYVDAPAQDAAQSSTPPASGCRWKRHLECRQGLNFLSVHSLTESSRVSDQPLTLIVHTRLAMNVGSNIMR